MGKFSQKLHQKCVINETLLKNGSNLLFCVLVSFFIKLTSCIFVIKITTHVLCADEESAHIFDCEMSCQRLTQCVMHANGRRVTVKHRLSNPHRQIELRRTRLQIKSHDVRAQHESWDLFS